MYLYASVLRFNWERVRNRRITSIIFAREASETGTTPIWPFFSLLYSSSGQSRKRLKTRFSFNHLQVPVRLSFFFFLRENDRRCPTRSKSPQRAISFLTVAGEVFEMVFFFFLSFFFSSKKIKELESGCKKLAPSAVIVSSSLKALQLSSRTLRIPPFVFRLRTLFPPTIVRRRSTANV